MEKKTKRDRWASNISFHLPFANLYFACGIRAKNDEFIFILCRVILVTYIKHG